MFSNFNFITSRLATGGGPVATDEIETLLDYGFTHIIDCRTFDDSALFGQYAGRVLYLYNPAEDDGLPKPVEWFKRSLDFALPALCTPGLGAAIFRCYAYCDAGINRGPSTAYAILRAWAGIYPNDAKALIRLRRPVDIAGLRYADDADAALKVLGFS
ncbi:MAG: hypothetical protein KGI71_05545 [Patescibacteria group bacterium]|nr:hypothetical protein [Patescibacteria group bacterium]